jgi:glyoxylase-like metal-dependent hydrolase (beta-lactamase superfamily II)
VSEPITIDVRMHGHEGLTAAFLVSGEKTALIETGPKSTVQHVVRGLDEVGIDHLDYIIVTHVHLDHAGAAGTLAAQWPAATVAVHGIGAPHLAEPSRLWKSAARIYGDDMERLWGGIDPVPRERILSLSDGDRIDLGGRVLQAFDTPGHAYHHHAFLDDATGALFAGDGLGVLLQDVGLVRPATPPPEFNLEAAKESIMRIKSPEPASVWPTHFGEVVRPVAEVCDEAVSALEDWCAWVSEGRRKADDLDGITAVVQDRVRSALEHRLSEDQMARLERTTSYRLNTLGYMRYLDKKEAAAS